ncbi:hypothetical protein GLOIN_2v1812174 [Rhizophagus irregularis DAOM 181602=DAOM 197198]|nr:hypothetical protein GLOIN_2v1812174 [Rhizophagus irregularis DAOM 181602=DAOM 197198]
MRLKCQHILSINSLKKLKQKNCPKCREIIQDNDIKYLPQNAIYKHLYSQFFEAGHILPSIEKEDSTNNQYHSDSGDSEIDLMLTKKKRILKAIKFKSKYIIKVNISNWKKTASNISKCLNNYEQAHFYLNEAIELKGKKPNAWYIRGEIHLRQGNYNDAVRDLIASIKYNAKIANLYMMIGISYYKNNNNKDALKYFDIVLQNDPNNHLCLKYCAYIYEKKKIFSNTLKMLGKYGDAITYFTKANNIDPENVHNLTRRAIIYYILQEYDKALLDFNNIIQLDTSNSLAYNYKGLIEDNISSILTFKKCIELDPNNDLEKMYLKDSSNYLPQISNIDYKSKVCEIYIELKKYEDAALDLNRLFGQYIIKKYTQPGITNDFDLYMYNAKGVYFMSNLMNLNYNCQFQGSTNLNSYIIFKAGDNAIFTNRRHKLKHKDILKLEGLGWILYVSFHSVYIDYRIQLSIETSNSIDMQIEYVQITKDYHKELPKMDHSLPLYTNNIPETFKKKYFLRKETENLLELKDIIDY